MPHDLGACDSRCNGIKIANVTQNRISAAVREPMLSAGEVDAVTGFTYLSAIFLSDRGVPAEDLVAFRYADYGCEAYGFIVISNSGNSHRRRKFSTTLSCRPWAAA